MSLTASAEGGAVRLIQSRMVVNTMRDADHDDINEKRKESVRKGE